MKALTFLKIFTALNVVIATGFAIAGIVSPYLLLAANITTGKAITVFALYAGARGIPMALLTIMSRIQKALECFHYPRGSYRPDTIFRWLYWHLSARPICTVGPFVIAAIQFAAIYLAVSNNNKINDRINKIKYRLVKKPGIPSKRHLKIQIFYYGKQSLDDHRMFIRVRKGKLRPRRSMLAMP